MEDRLEPGTRAMVLVRAVSLPQLVAWSPITQPLVGAQVACENDGNEVGRPEDSLIEMEPYCRPYM